MSAITGRPRPSQTLGNAPLIVRAQAAVGRKSTRARLPAK